MALADQLIGQLARDIPGATRVFDTYQLDFCCAGKQTLRDAAGSNLTAIVAELERLKKSQHHDDRDWQKATVYELIDYIVTRFHNLHREQLPELIRLARRVERVHSTRENCPNGLAEALHALHQGMESHMRKEELILFPLMSKDNRAETATPISLMRAEHRDHGNALHHIESLTQNMTLPLGACDSWRTLYDGLIRFRKDLMMHIHLENNVLFERFACLPSI